ncbi:MAG: T9SS type A sorting domain-containing protein [Cytophagaceae bacterium]|nr:T9SS type A sorting domain-containing protein [Cytophagaceae bacterium]
MKKSFLVLLLLAPLLVLGQQKVQIKESFLKFPPNMADWIRRHVGNYNPYNEAFGTKIGSNQSKQFYDFNKDGKKDICIELGLEYFRPQAKYDSAYAYYKGIFINKGNDVFELDTNFIINGRGRPWYGKFGDFNGDGLVDYAHVNENYHGDQAKKPLDLFTSKDSPDGSPSHVFFNNGKSFDRVNLDTEYMITEHCQVDDINEDGRDEIISTPSGKFIVYRYNLKSKQFDRSLDNINQIIKQKYGNSIKFFNFEKIENHKIKVTISHDFTSGNLNDWKIDIAEIGLNDSTFNVINSFKHPMYLSKNGTLANADIQANDSYKYEDLNDDGKMELIMISPFTSIPEFQGFNIIENNQIVTSKYWTQDLNEPGFRIQGYIKDFTGDNKSDIIASEWNLDKSQKYFNYYYHFTNGKYVNTKMSLTANSVKPLNIPYWTWVEDFNEDGSNDVFIFNNNNVLESYYYKTINCKSAVKPVINTSKLTYCANETLKLSISNNASGDVYKWYFGKQVDSSNVSTKIYSDSGKLVISKTDANGCTSQSDTLTISKFTAIPTPNITRDGGNLVSSSTSGNQWYLDGVKLANETNSSIKASSNGVYTVQVTGSNGCSSDASKGEYGLITATEALEPQSIGVFPNPFMNQIRLEFPSSFGIKARISLTDIAGKFIIQKSEVSQGQELNLSFLSAGNYFLRMESMDQTQNKTIKITKAE